MKPTNPLAQFIARNSLRALCLITKGKPEHQEIVDIKNEYLALNPKDIYYTEQIKLLSCWLATWEEKRK